VKRMWLRIGFSCLSEHCTSLPDSVKALKFLAGRATMRFSRSRPSFLYKKWGLCLHVLWSSRFSYPRITQM